MITTDVPELESSNAKIKQLYTNGVASVSEG